MNALLIVTGFLAVAGGVAAVFFAWSRGPTVQAEADAGGKRPAGFSLFMVAMAMAVAGVIAAVLVPVVAVFHGEKLPAVIALLFFFPLPLLAYGFLRRFGYFEERKSGEEK